MLFRFLSTLLCFCCVSAIVSNCRSEWPIQIHVDPPAIVGTGQKVSVSLTVDVPTTIESGWLHLNAIVSPLINNYETSGPLCQYLPCPLTAGTHTWAYQDVFPAGFIGKVQFMFRLTPYENSQGGLVRNNPWVCVNWSAFATGHASNETSKFIQWMYQ